MNPPPLTLGIDPGTRITGYGIIDPATGRALDFGCIRPPPQLRLSLRYEIIHRSISELISHYKPQAVAVETQYVGKNVASAMKLSIARGMVMLAATQHGVPIFEYAPSKAKIAVVGTGRASKEQVQGMIQKLLNLPTLPEPEDAADALALAYCHIENCKSPLALSTQV